MTDSYSYYEPDFVQVFHKSQLKVQLFFLLQR